MRRALLPTGLVVLTCALGAQTPAAPAQSAPPATAPAFSVEITTVDATHTRFTITTPDDRGPVVIEARTATVSYMADGVRVHIDGPATMTTRGQTMRLDNAELRSNGKNWDMSTSFMSATPAQ